MLMDVVNSFRPPHSSAVLGNRKSNIGAEVVSKKWVACRVFVLSFFYFLIHPPDLRNCVQGRDQEDAHDFLEFLVDHMHQELLCLSGRAGDGLLSVGSPRSAAMAADAAKAAAEDEWLTKSGRRTTKRQQLKSDKESRVSSLFRGTTLRCEEGRFLKRVAVNLV